MYLKRDLKIRYQKGENSFIRMVEWKSGVVFSTFLIPSLDEEAPWCRKECPKLQSRNMNSVPT